ncbi:LOW QUALITY PROTEIN: glycogen [starch] synthase-like [Octopus sinensis]|uniref:Glycogen [starch] synthase n=1 Tax=Octopus sinensis TaxID=2607531 RepID=A0A6P7U056_9MOLL|nr:LOW QUALITY PROTEIN: glycogen [starch] synthase-like [Octopus sinensis]
MTVVVFIIYPAAVNNFNVETLRGSAIGKQISDSVDEINITLKNRLLDFASRYLLFLNERGQLPGTTDILTPDDILKLKTCIKSAQRTSLPPVCTHNMVYDGCDPVLTDIRRCNLINAPEHRVKVLECLYAVVFHPEFLNSFNPLLPMEYLEFIRGCHLGIFPSYYEPWGYTPGLPF